MRYPEIDFLLVVSPAKSESDYHSKFQVRVLEVSKMIPKSVVYLTKFRTCRSFLYPSSLSLSILFDNSLTELFRSGLECLTIYNNEPTPDW